MEGAVFPFQQLRQGNAGALRDWLARGGQIDAPLLGAVAETWTPLMLACAEGDATLVRIIIEVGRARPSARVGTKVLASSAPLHVASRYGHLGVAAALLELGAVVDAQDTLGITPLQYAVGNCHLRTTELLLSAGADPSARGMGGATALDFAEMAGFEDVAILLRRRTLGDSAAAKRKALGSWLEALGCEEFLPRFLTAGYDDLTFLAEQKLSEADLDCVGVPREKLGLRKKLLAMHGVKEFLEDVGEDDGSSSGTTATEEASTVTSNSGDESSEEDSQSEEEPSEDSGSAGDSDAESDG